jgi:hypothetical protein
MTVKKKMQENVNFFSVLVEESHIAALISDTARFELCEKLISPTLPAGTGFCWLLLHFAALRLYKIGECG